MYGQLTDVGICFQNSFGTLNTASMHWLPFVSEGVGLEIPPMISENMRGVFDEGDTYEGPRMVSGELDCEAQPVPLGALIQTVLGAPASSVNSGAIYTHTFEPRTADFDVKAANTPVTYVKQFDVGSAQVFSDLNGSMLELTMAQGALLKSKVNFVGGNFTQQAALTPSYPQGKRWTWDTASLSLGGAGISEFTELTITLEESLEAMHTLSGSKYPSRIKRSGMRTVAVAGTVKFDSQDEYQQFLSQSERELDLTLTGVTQIQSGYYDSLRIQLPLMRYSEANPGAGGPGELEMGITAAGKYSVTSGTSLRLTLVNTKAAY